MKLATSTGDFRVGYHTDEERVRALYRAGFRNIDLSLYKENTAASIYMRDDWKKQTDQLRRTADALGMTFVQSHAPDCNPLNFDEHWELQVAVTVRALEVCAELGIPVSVFHTGWADGIGKEEYFEQNMRFVRRLIPTMEKTGVMLLIENSTRANMGSKYYFLTGQDMKDFLAYAGHPLLGACWDTGHANIEGHQYDDIVTLGNDLRAIHFNDNRGGGDEHIMPYLGTMSVDEVMCGLRDIDYKGAFTFECDSTLRPANYWQGDRRRWREECAAEPPLALRETMERALYDCGLSILTQYGYPVE